MKLTLYHYTKADSMLSILKEDGIRLSVPDDCNDPLEFQPAYGSSESSRPSNNEIDKLRYRADTGFISFSQRFDSSTMWAHYADGHKGVCIEFEFELDDANCRITDEDDEDVPENSMIVLGNPEYYKQFYCLDEDNALYAPLLCKMMYSMERPNDTRQYLISPRKPGPRSRGTRFSRVFTTKSMDWAYEREYRLFAQLSHCAQDDSGHYLVHGLTGCIKRILLGKRCTHTKSQVARILYPLMDAGRIDKELVIDEVAFHDRYYAIQLNRGDITDKGRDVDMETDALVRLNKQTVDYLIRHGACDWKNPPAGLGLMLSSFWKIKNHFGI